MPVHADTTSATSSGPTSSLSMTCSWPSITAVFSASSFSSAGMRP